MPPEIPPHTVPDGAGATSVVDAGREPVDPDGGTSGPASRPDPVCAAAVEVARAAAAEVAGAAVGDHLGVEAEPGSDGDLVVTHSFATLEPGYVGWRWAVTVARAPDSDRVTVDEVVLLPGGEALLAPPWVPWSERLQPGDLGPGDLLPPPENDTRLVPSYADVDAERLPFDLHRELGLGRPRVLSAEGRADAAQRWFEGEPGPFSPLAKTAPGRCADCGFLVPVAGSLGRMFGVCANALAPDDGRVVALLHGCGAHSETVTTSAHAATAGLAVEPEEVEMVDLPPRPAPDSRGALEHAAGLTGHLPAPGDTGAALGADEPAAAAGPPSAEEPSVQSASAGSPSAEEPSGDRSPVAAEDAPDAAPPSTDATSAAEVAPAPDVADPT